MSSSISERTITEIVYNCAERLARERFHFLGYETFEEMPFDDRRDMILYAATVLSGLPVFETLVAIVPGVQVTLGAALELAHNDQPEDLVRRARASAFTVEIVQDDDEGITTTIKLRKHYRSAIVYSDEPGAEQVATIRDADLVAVLDHGGATVHIIKDRIGDTRTIDVLALDDLLADSEVVTRL